MTSSPRYAYNDDRFELNVNNLDDMQPRNLRFSPVGSRSYYRENQYQEPESSERYQITKTPERSTSRFCSKLCLIGLLIGLIIGCLMVLAVALPVGLTKKYAYGTISNTPNWIGTYQMDNSCVTTSCCCLSNQIFVTQTSYNQIQITGSTTGVCGGSSSTVTLVLTTPSGFQSSATWNGETILLILGQDSGYMAFVNANFRASSSAVCSATALRTSFNAGSIKSINLGLVMLIPLITIGMMK